MNKNQLKRIIKVTRKNKPMELTLLEHFTLHCLVRNRLNHYYTILSWKNPPHIITLKDDLTTKLETLLGKKINPIKESIYDSIDQLANRRIDKLLNINANNHKNKKHKSYNVIDL